MKILVCSKVSIPSVNRTLPVWDRARQLGNDVVVVNDMGCLSKLAPGYTPDVLIGMGVGVMEETLSALERYPKASLYCYNWDCYEWVWTNPRPNEYDYNRYGELLKKATEIWVPSGCTKRRTKQWWGLDNVKVILSSCPYWYQEQSEDWGYILCALRKIPDPYWAMFERACKELDIPYRMTNHECSYAEYQDTVAHCRCLVSHFYEASTGGLTLLEAYYLGKPSLVSDSEWHGGRDYLGDRAVYFRHDEYDDFKNKLWEMYHHPPKLDKASCRDWVRSEFSDERMVENILGRIEVCPWY